VLKSFLERALTAVAEPELAQEPEPVAEPEPTVAPEPEPTVAPEPEPGARTRALRRHQPFVSAVLGQQQQLWATVVLLQPAQPEVVGVLIGIVLD